MNLPAARLKLLPEPRRSKPPLMAISLLGLNVPVFVPLPIVTTPVLLIVTCPVPVVNVAPEVVVPTLMAATPVEAWPTTIEAEPGCEKVDPLPCRLNVADVVAPPAAASVKL